MPRTIMQMPTIAQIGDLPLHMHLSEWHGRELSAQGKSYELTTSYRAAIAHNPYIPEMQDVSLKVVIYAVHGLSVSHLRNLLERLLGRHLDIFAYEMIGCQDDFGYCCCQYGYADLLWLKTVGRLTDVRLNSSDFRFLTGRIDLELHSYWTPVSTAIWKIGSKDYATPAFTDDETIAAPYEDHITPYPGPEKWLRTKTLQSWYSLRPVDRSFVYDPDYGVALCNKHDPNLPRCRYASTWAVCPGGNPPSYAVFATQPRWSAPPSSLYMFKGFENGDTDLLTIEVRREDEIWDIAQTTTTIDVGEIDDLMTTAGYTLATTDVIVVGDVLQQPGFVLRAGEKLVFIGSAVTRDGGMWPGQLAPGYNRIVIDSSDGYHAQHHVFRSL